MQRYESPEKPEKCPNCDNGRVSLLTSPSIWEHLQAMSEDKLKLINEHISSGSLIVADSETGARWLCQACNTKIYPAPKPRIRSRGKPEQCTNCKSTRFAEMLYGLLKRTPEMERLQKTGEVISMGCNVVDDGPAWKCRDCGTVVYRELS